MDLLLALVLLTSPVATNHGELNPAFAALLNQGVAVEEDRHVPLPQPVLADDLDGDAQQRTIQNSCGDYGYERFVRDSVVAPYIYEYRTIDDQNPAFLVYGIDVLFVAYGELDSIVELDTQQFFNLTESASDAKIVALDEVALKQFGISPAVRDGLRERYEHVAYPLFDRVYIEVTNQAHLSVTDESIVRATRLDDRFANSEEYPNQWRSMDIGGTGEVEYGTPHVFRGTGMYLKITELTEPAGALFVEYHSVSVEPHGWFNGAPLIRSKLRLLLQREVRKFRRTLRD